MRGEFSKSVKRAAFLRADGRCEHCHAKLAVGKFEYDHAIEAFIGGWAAIDNCVVLCIQCHKDKTKARRAAIDKVRRISDKRMGIRRKSRPIPGSRASGLRKRMNGDVERRQ